MEPFQEYVDEYRKQLEKGAVQKAYRGLMQYMMDLRTHLRSKYPDYVISGGIYFGYMDMTYFSFSPKSLERRKLKVAIVLIHQPLRFEAWLAGYNKQVQSEFWQLFKASGWDKYHVVPTTKGADSIVEDVLVGEPDFCDLDNLTARIETATLKFTEDILGFLSRYLI